MSYQVTIITSVLNGVWTLQRCVESVANQTFPCEHIIVDAGSTDGTLELIRRLQSDRVRLIEAPGVGISDAFNIGIENSHGNVIGILNDDDWYERDAVSRSLDALDTYPEAGFTYGSILLHRPNRITLARPVKPDQLTRAAKQFLPFAHISSFVRRAIYRAYGGYDPQYQVAMDFDFYARIISQGVEGVLVEGIIGHAELGGLSDNRGRRFREYWLISSRYYGNVPAFLVLGYFNMRSIIYEVANSLPVTRALFKRLPLGNRFVELTSDDVRIG